MTDDLMSGQLRVGPERPLSHLVVVAGLKGAGKSSFIRSVARKTLPSPITALLPQGVDRWAEWPAGGAETWLPVLLREARSIPGSILHYDLHHRFRTGPEHPSAKALLLARRLTVVNIVPALDRLTAQFDRRESTALLLRLPFGGRAPNDAVSTERIRARRSEVLGLYATPGWAEQVYLSWNAFLRDAAAGADIAVIEVEPDAPLGAAPAWRLKTMAPAQGGG